MSYGSIIPSLWSFIHHGYIEKTLHLIEKTKQNKTKPNQKKKKKKRKKRKKEKHHNPGNNTILKKFSVFTYKLIL